MAPSGQRHDLNGEPVEASAPEHVHHAIMEVFRRRQQRSKEDLKPWVVSRLVNAIDASELSRDDYLARVNPNSDEAFALVQDAFAEIAARTAKREALKRAYVSSGKSVEEFAQMYGLSVAEAKDALA